MQFSTRIKKVTQKFVRGPVAMLNGQRTFNHPVCNGYRQLKIVNRSVTPQNFCMQLLTRIKRVTQKFVRGPVAMLNGQRTFNHPVCNGYRQLKICQL